MKLLISDVRHDVYAGLTLCLFWNVIAVTAAWIKGEGWYLKITAVCLHLVNG